MADRIELPYPNPLLADGVVRLRPWESKDVRSAVEAKGFGEAAALDWIAATRRRQTDGAGLALAIADAETDEALGVVGVLFRPTPGQVPVAAERATAQGLVYPPEPAIVGIGYWVLERARGRGLASRAVSLLSEWTLTDAGIARVEAFVEPGNVASQRVLDKAGFALEGRLRSYLRTPTGREDALIYARVAASA